MSFGYHAAMGVDMSMYSIGESLRRGDRVRVRAGFASCHICTGGISLLQDMTYDRTPTEGENMGEISDNRYVVMLAGRQYIFCRDHIRKINKNKPNKSKENNMSLTEKFVALLQKEPQKSLHKAGLTDSRGLLTEEGVKVYLTWHMNQEGNAEKFSEEVAKPLLEEQEK